MSEALLRVLAPSSVDEAAEMIREAAAAARSLLPCGRRTRLQRHGVDAAPDAWLSFSKLDRILEIDAEDQTCVVEPGLAPEVLDQALAPHGLELAVAAPCGAKGSLGGLFLAPDLSLLHAAWGPPRDQVLGAEWLLADGSAVRTGARVVKSVAGYDVTRLFLGSRGRLAACTRLVLRLRPRPRCERWYRLALRQVPAWSPAAAATRLPARMLFSPGADASGASWAWAQVEGLQPDSSLYEREASPEAGRAALSQCLREFERHSHRLAVTASRARRLARARFGGATDWLSSCLAWSGSDPAELGLAPGEHARVVPHRAPSAWLRLLQEACAPEAPPFGAPGEDGAP